MKNRIIKAASTALVVLGMLTLSACVEERYPAYPAYGYAPGYSYEAPPVIVGDYDEHHVWHDRDWWVDNHHDWVENHHSEWMEHHPAVHHDRDDVHHDSDDRR